MFAGEEEEGKRREERNWLAEQLNKLDNLPFFKS